MAIGERLPPRVRAPVRQLASVLSAALWVGPAVAGVVALALAVVLGGIEDPWVPIDLPFEDPEAARATLTTVVSATVAATSLTVTGTIVALQLATGQFSPRLLRDALRDRGIQAVLSTFIGTTVYGLAVLPRLGADSNASVAVALGVALGLTMAGMLVFFLHSIVNRLRLETIIGDVVERTLRVIEATHPRDHEPRHVTLPDHAVTVPTRRSGYVQAASLDALAEVAANHEVHLKLRPRVGSFLVEGTAVAHLWRSDAQDLPGGDELETIGRAIDRAIALGVDRTVEGDPAYGLRHLVDVALRAVSPAINDPTTAAQCCHHATRVLVALASRPLADGVTERDGHVAIVSRPGLASHLELAQTQLLQASGDDPWVVEALVHQLRDTLQAGTVEGRVELVREHAERIRQDVARRDLAPHVERIAGAALDQLDRLLDGHTTDDEHDAAG